jgi:hypothetical protein
VAVSAENPEMRLVPPAGIKVKADRELLVDASALAILTVYLAVVDSEVTSIVSTPEVSLNEKIPEILEVPATLVEPSTALKVAVSLVEADVRFIAVVPYGTVTEYVETPALNVGVTVRLEAGVTERLSLLRVISGAA